MGIICERTADRLNRLAKEMEIGVQVEVKEQKVPGRGRVRWYSVGSSSFGRWSQAVGLSSASEVEEDFRVRARNRAKRTRS